jgi:hypothetical protein
MPPASAGSEAEVLPATSTAAPPNVGVSLPVLSQAQAAKSDLPPVRTPTPDEIAWLRESSDRLETAATPIRK